MIARGFGWPQWGLGVEGVNSRVGRWLLDELAVLHSRGDRYRDTRSVWNITEEDTSSIRGIKGWAFIDFFHHPVNLPPLIVEFNFVE